MHTSSSIIARLRAVLPARWFADDTPVLDALLAGLADAWVRLHALLDAARRQLRARRKRPGNAGFDIVGCSVSRSRRQCTNAVRTAKHTC